MQVPSIHGDNFILNHNCQYFNQCAMNEEVDTKPLLNTYISHRNFIYHSHQRKITNYQTKSLVVGSNPKFAIIGRYIIHNISQHQVKFLSHYQASCQNSKHCSSISIIQIMSNSCSTNFKHNNIYRCMSWSPTNTSSIYIFIL